MEPEVKKELQDALAAMHEYVHREMDRLHQIHQILCIFDNPNISQGQAKECFHALKVLSDKGWKQDS